MFWYFLYVCVYVSVRREHEQLYSITSIKTCTDRLSSCSHSHSAPTMSAWRMEVIMEYSSPSRCSYFCITPSAPMTFICYISTSYQCVKGDVWFSLSWIREQCGYAVTPWTRWWALRNMAVPLSGGEECPPVLAVQACTLALLNAIRNW